NLKKIASICGIERRVTFHKARHTYASVITLSQGVPLDTVRELMGHRDWRATQIYAHLTNDKVSEDMGRLQERIGNKFELTDNEREEVLISTPQIKHTKRMKS
ncbi:tyrosine-type recombinase/integrase, partial [uncultured Bacteroides sp.]